MMDDESRRFLYRLRLAPQWSMLLSRTLFFDLMRYIQLCKLIAGELISALIQFIPANSPDNLMDFWMDYIEFKPRMTCRPSIWITRGHQSHGRLFNQLRKKEFHVFSLIYVRIRNKTYFNVKKKCWKFFLNICFHKLEKFHWTGAWNDLKFSGNT